LLGFIEQLADPFVRFIVYPNS